MKKNLLATIAILSILPFISQAQWTSGGSGNYYLTSGYASIGTVTPLGNLHVHTSTNQNLLARGAASLSGGVSLYSVNDANSATAPMEFGASQFLFAGGSFGINTTTPLGNFDTKLATNQHIQFVPNVNGGYFGAAGIVCINDANTAYTPLGFYASNYYFGGGNIGIGTDNPISLFQVDDGCTKANIGDASGPGLNYGTSYLGFNAARSGTSWTMHSDGGNNGGGLIYSDIFGNMNFAAIVSTASASNQVLSDATVKGKIYMQITKTGTVRAKDIVVETGNWPDYVFKPAYKLPSLASVKAYIDQNQRLPEMPSEQDVAKNGIDLGEMVKLQTKKIEELTLYLLKENEAKQAQQKEIDELRRQVETLLKRKS
jgi:hypothetical protein